MTLLGTAAPWDISTDKVCPHAILVVGGGSACGQYATQLAKIAGIQTIIVVGGDERNLKRRGATHVIDRHMGHTVIGERIRRLVEDELLYALDTVNGVEGLDLPLRALSTRGQGRLARLVPIDQISDDLTRGHQVLDVFGE